MFTELEELQDLGLSKSKLLFLALNGAEWYVEVDAMEEEDLVLGESVDLLGIT